MGMKMERQQKMSGKEKYSLQGRVYYEIHEGILTGKYQKGEELREKTLGEAFGVSRTPVREALRQLELEGLVQMIPNKGAVVVGLSSKDIKDIYEIRSRLEGLCAKWATQNVTEEKLAELESNVELSEFHAAKGRYAQVVELDNEFHNQLYDMADSQMLYRTLAGFHHYLEILRKKTLSSKERVCESIQEHRAILEAIKRKDENQAEELASIHMVNAIQNIEAHRLWECVSVHG